MEHFFAYGTLQPGSNLKYFEQNDLSKYLFPKGKGTVRGELLHLRNTKLNIEYPAMIKSNDESKQVHGTLYEVRAPEEAFKIMDMHELYTTEPNTNVLKKIDLYERMDVLVECGGDTISARAYALNQNSEFLKSGVVEVLGSVPSGDWLKHIGH